MLRLSILVLVLIAILVAEAKPPKRRKGKHSREQEEIDALLKSFYRDVERRLNAKGSTDEMDDITERFFRDVERHLNAKGPTEELDELTAKVDDLERRLNAMGSTGAVDAAAITSGSCPNPSPIHMHFHGEEVEHDHEHDHKDGGAQETHVHIDLGIDMDEFHDFHRFSRRMHKHIDPEEEYSAKCVMMPVDPNSRMVGELEFKQHGKDPTVTVDADFEELPAADTHYDLHVHVKGDISNMCASLGPHYDPFDPDVDVGDLGGVTSDSDKAVDHEFTGVRLSLFGPLSIIGRSVIIHDENGDRMACCVIGWEHSPHDVADSHEDMHGHAHGHGMGPNGKMHE